MDNMSISISHINIRLSISILLIKLIVLELITAILIILFHTSLFIVENEAIYTDTLRPFMIPVFLFIIFIKLTGTIFIIIQWVNEYYEISKNTLYHRKGVIFKTEEKYPLEHIAFIEFHQGILGRIFNFGSISLCDARRKSYEEMYLIHNPMRYARVIESILPNVDEKKKIIRNALVEKDLFDLDEE